MGALVAMNGLNESRRVFLHRCACAAVGAAVPRGTFSSAIGQAAESPDLAAAALKFAKLQARAADVAINVSPLRGDLSELSGGPNGNMVLLAPAKGVQGKLMVDSGYTSAREQLTKAMAKTGAAPVELLINTHCHWDHVGGNVWLHAQGAKIEATEQTRLRIAKPMYMPAFKLLAPAIGPDGLPTEFIKEESTLSFGNENVTLRHYPAAHTDSDLVVHFQNADVLVAGDTLVTGDYLFIDYANGGTLNGTVDAIKRNLERTTSQTIVVPGHGATGTRDHLAQTLDMLTGLRETVGKLRRQGLDLEEIVNRKPSAPYDRYFGATNDLDAQRYITKLVYDGLVNVQ